MSFLAILINEKHLLSRHMSKDVCNGIFIQMYFDVSVLTFPLLKQKYCLFRHLQSEGQTVQPPYRAGYNPFYICLDAQERTQACA